MTKTRILSLFCLILILFSACTVPQGSTPPSPAEVSPSSQVPEADTSAPDSTPPDAVTPGLPEISPAVSPGEVSPSPTATVAPSAAPPSAAPDVSPQVSEPPAVKTVLLGVLGPGDVWVIETSPVEYTDGMTALDALTAACAAADVTLTLRGSGRTAYVAAIGDYAERGQGPLSGWVYKRNGEYMSVGLGSTTLAPDDKVVLYYTLDLGLDVKNRED